ncbi:hypothetical protein JRQ81_009347 [Phrynocephalus forsythii]|uniref:DC-STAMP domain-containing protein 2 n=1 Tax=Phrynocephalus forsythii TaxID=171643 RepID=A0A9Q0XCZ9_9SAUR|nr:hypothetical protein JRQ81_009347 [Phrynocephalus forsythii]
MGLLSHFNPTGWTTAWRKRRARKKKTPRAPSPEEDSMGRSVARSLGGFSLGMTLSGAYGALVLFAQGYNIWYCLLSTITLAVGLGLGMAFSFKVRATVLLMLPQIFSREGKMMLMFMAFCLAMEGPFMNIIRNFTRSAEAVSCGAELALNQTVEMMQRAREPLLNALKKIKDIAQKAKVVGDRVRKLFRSVMDSVRHVAHCLRNVWYWLLNLGKICNEEMGAPYRKCVRIFENAKDQCQRAVPLFYYLCYIVLLFKYLCGLANVLLVFCVIPQYIVPFLRRRVAEPIVDLLDRVRAEFEFNLTTVHRYEVNINASRSLSQVAFDLMEEVSARLQPAQEAVGFFGYTSTLVMLFMYIKALLYRKHYLNEDSFDNIYITEAFLEMDAMRRKTQRLSVLPLSAKESTKYIRPASFTLPRKEQLRYALALISICRQLILVTLLIVADFSVFWLLDLVRYHLHGEIVARAPVAMSVDVHGSGYTGEVYRDMVSAFDVLQQGNISVLSRQCRLRPSEPDYNSYIIISLMYGSCFFIAIFGTYIQRLQRAVCAWYYPSRERERICYLYNTILTRRTSLAQAVLKAVRAQSADGGHTNVLVVLAAKFRMCAWLVKKLGIHEAYCMGCGRIREGDDNVEFVTCSTPACRGIYCPSCYKLLNNTCSICMAPLTFQGEMDEEMDSSDEETMALWIGAVQSLRDAPDEVRRSQRQRLKARIARAVKGRGGCRRLPPELAQKILTQLKEDEEESDSEGSPSSSSEEEGSSPTSSGSGTSLDFSYQQEAETSGSEELEEVRGDGQSRPKN